MDQRCTIERRTVVSDGGGGQTETWAPAAANVRCRSWYGDGRGQEETVGDRTSEIIDRRVMLPASTDVRHEDRLVNVTDRAGATVFAEARIDALRRYRSHLELLVTEVT